MDIVNLAVVVVFVSNAVILILLVYMLIRILGQTEQTRDMMVCAARELNDSARVLRDAGYKVVDVVRGGGAPAAPTVTATPVAGIEMLDKLNHMMEEMAQQGEDGTEQALTDIKRMMEGLTQVDPSKLAEWHRKHKTELEHAVAQRNRLASETEQMRQRLLDAHRIILELRRANKAAEAAGQTVDHMRAEMAKQQQLLDRAKERIRMAETKAEHLKADVERLSMLNPAGAAENEALKEARRKLAEVSRERDEQVRELDQLKGAMQRTLVEKDFIEDHFMRLDGSRQGLPRPPADPEAGSPADKRADPHEQAAHSGQNAALEPA